MHRKSIGLSAVAVIGAILSPMGRFAAPALHRVTSGSKQGRRLNSRTLKVSRNTPHYGKKEQERAKRFYMVDTHPNGEKRSAPTMEQHSSTWFF